MSRQLFTDEEWAVLRQAPISVMTAIVLADKTDPVPFLKEVVLAIRVLLKVSHEPHASDLVSAVQADLRQLDASEGIENEELILRREFQFLGAVQELKNAAEGRAESLEDLQQVASVLAPKVTLAQAEEFKGWLLAIARKIAASFKEEGFMGIGGERISGEEDAVIRKIDQILSPKATA